MMFKKEKNEIKNKKLKETIADWVLTLLKQGEDYNELVYTQVEFGYLFSVKNHGVEALFKVTTDKDTFYFAAQKVSIMRLNFNEERFYDTTKQFLEIHG